MRVSFSERLRALIEERRMTQIQLAFDLRIPVSTLGGYVQGTSEPDFDTLKVIASYFDVTTDFLLGHPTADTKDSKEEDLLRIYRTLSLEDRKVYLEQGKAFIRYKSLHGPLSSS